MTTFSKGTLERFNLHTLEGRTSLDVFKEMMDELSHDLDRAKTEVHSTGGQYERRIYLRTLMSYSEAMLFRLKQHLIDQRDNLGITILENEKLILNEQSIEMTDDGRLKRKSVNVSHEKNVKFTFKFIARKLELTCGPEFGNGGWDEYKKTVIKRNDLTHPKFPQDIQISDVELASLDSADKWFRLELVKLVNGWAERANALKTLNASNGEDPAI